MTGLLSPVHLALVALVLLIVFGGRRLPQLGRLTGQTIRTRVLGKPPATPPALPEPPPAGPGSHPAVVAAQPQPTVSDVMRAPARQHVIRTVLRRVPGPVGWVARMFVR